MVGEVVLEQNTHKTMKFNVESEESSKVREVIGAVYEALSEKEYNPINQIVGYILSGDPTYITSHKNARSLIGKVERDEILEVLVEEYLKNL